MLGEYRRWGRALLLLVLLGRERPARSDALKRGVRPELFACSETCGGRGGGGGWKEEGGGRREEGGKEVEEGGGGRKEGGKRKGSQEREREKRDERERERRQMREECEGKRERQEESGGGETVGLWERLGGAVAGRAAAAFVPEGQRSSSEPAISLHSLRPLSPHPFGSVSAHSVGLLAQCQRVLPLFPRTSTTPPTRLRAPLRGWIVNLLLSLSLSLSAVAQAASNTPSRPPTLHP
eukprot:2452328-Rhodomonas_salina.1